MPPVRVNPDLPIDLERTVNKCLEKDRDLRYQHAADIRTDRQRLKRDTASSSGFTVAIQKGRSWYQRPRKSLSGGNTSGFASYLTLNSKKTGMG